MSKKSNLCICLGYESLVIPLKLIDEGKNVVIYSNRLDILKFCKFQQIPYIIAPIISRSDYAFNSRIVKKKIFKSLESYNLSNYSIHVTHKNFGVNSLILSLFPTSQKFFHRTEIDLENDFHADFWPTEKSKTNIRYLYYYWLIERFLLLYYYRIDVTYRYYLGTLIPVVTDSWLKSATEVIKYENRYDLFSAVYSQYSVNVSRCQNLFLHTDVDEMSKYITKESLLEAHNFILKRDVVVKGHPNRDFQSSDLNSYPSYIPAELLVAKCNNSVVGLSSTTLGFASLQDTVKSVSFIDIVNWTDSSKKKFYKNNLIKSKGKTYFPKTFEELDSLLR